MNETTYETEDSSPDRRNPLLPLCAGWPLQGWSLLFFVSLALGGAVGCASGSAARERPDGSTGDGNVYFKEAGTDPGVCGDGVVDSGEVCDDGNTLDGDDCRSDCGQDLTLCGNGTMDPGEACDDGNSSDGDGCSSVCQSDQ